MLESRSSLSSTVESEPEVGSELESIRANRRLGLAARLGPWSWQGRIFWLAVLSSIAWFLDKPLAQSNVARDNLIVLSDLRDATRQFGEPMGLAWISLVIWVVDRTRRRPLLLAFVTVLIASALVTNLKWMIGRERPKASGGETVFRGPTWFGEMDPDPSLPSGHTTVAFTFAFGLCRLYSKHRKLWLTFAVACAASRALGGAHFLTDVIFASWLGWELGRLAWLSPFGRWIARRIDRRFPVSNRMPAWNWELGFPA